MLGTNTNLCLTVPPSWEKQLTSTWLVLSFCGSQPTSACQLYHSGTTTPSMTVQSSWVLPPTSTWQFHFTGNHYLPLPDRSIILGTTTQIYLTIRSPWGPISISTWEFILLGIKTHLYLTVQSSWGPLSTSAWQLHHHGDHYPSLPDSSIILGTITRLWLVTVPSSLGGPLPTSTWLFHHHGYHYRPLIDSSIILGSIIHLNLTVQSSWGHYPSLPGIILWTLPTTQLPMCTRQFNNPGDHYQSLSDSSIILGPTIYLYLLVPSSCGSLPLRTSIWQFNYPGYPYPNST